MAAFDWTDLIKHLALNMAKLECAWKQGGTRHSILHCNSREEFDPGGKSDTRAPPAIGVAMGANAAWKTPRLWRAKFSTELPAHSRTDTSRQHNEPSTSRKRQKKNSAWQLDVEWSSHGRCSKLAFSRGPSQRLLAEMGDRPRIRRTAPSITLN